MRIERRRGRHRNGRTIGLTVAQGGEEGVGGRREKAEELAKRQMGRMGVGRIERRTLGDIEMKEAAQEPSLWVTVAGGGPRGKLRCVVGT